MKCCSLEHRIAYLTRVSTKGAIASQHIQQIRIMAPKTAWATQVDAEEADGAEALPALPAAFAASTAFPSLGDAVKVQETKAEKKKRAQKMSLADLHSRWASDM